MFQLFQHGRGRQLEARRAALAEPGPLALIGLSSAIPTKPFVASGRLGPPQLAAAETLLRALATEPGRPCRVVMIHHPPHPGGASPGRELKDAAAFTAMIGRVGADLILHGHNHIASLARIAGPGGRSVPIVGVPGSPAEDTSRERGSRYTEPREPTFGVVRMVPTPALRIRVMLPMNFELSMTRRTGHE